MILRINTLVAAAVLGGTLLPWGARAQSAPRYLVESAPAALDAGDEAALTSPESEGVVDFSPTTDEAESAAVEAGDTMRIWLPRKGLYLVPADPNAAIRFIPDAHGPKAAMEFTRGASAGESMP